MRLIFNSGGWATSVYTGNQGATFVAQAGAIEAPDSDDWQLYKLVEGVPTLQSAEARDTYDRTSTQAAKADALKAAELAYLQFCETLGFAEKAGTTAIQGVVLTIEDTRQAAQCGIVALSLIHEVEIQGGSYAGIPTTAAEVNP